ERIPFNPLEFGWDFDQQLNLAALYLLLALPFFFVASAIGLSYSHLTTEIGGIYRADLLGAGLGSLAIIGLLFVLDPEDGLRAIAALGLIASALALLGAKGKGRLAGFACLAPLLALVLLWPGALIAPAPSEYKALSLALRVPGAEIIAQRTSPLGRLDLVESPTIPFRHAPGLSLANRLEPPEQLGLFTDGDSMQAITRFEGDLERLAYLDMQTGALPYHLLERPKTLLLGSGTGGGIWLARLHGAASIDAVELNPQTVELVKDRFAAFAGRVYEGPELSVHIAEARSFVQTTQASYDLIQLSLLDSFSAAAAGVHALNESTTYTKEAFEVYLARLEEGGLLAITRWLRVPPRDALKLFATALQALEARGASEPENQLALIRGWKTTTLLVKNGAFEADEIAALRRFCTERWFDLAYYPGIEAGEANRYNLLERPYLYLGTKALIGPQAQSFMGDYKYALEPATDDKPYFGHFLKWRALVELIGLRAKGGLALVEWGYVILLATLALALAASAVFILLPIPFLKRAARSRSQGPSSEGPGFARIAGYFFALGLAFLFIEIAFIQRFTLFLGHPLYAVAVVLAAFLVFAGIGSGFSQWLTKEAADPSSAGYRGRAIAIAISGIILVALAHLVALPPLIESTVALPRAAKIALALLFIAPLAFFMGMPFPLGLSRIAHDRPALVPWAFGINGFASVISAVLATLLAIHLGFTVVVGLALALYLSAALVFGRAR
ncbi:MAG: SAM-dependent methyltransferase, partial [Alphaproteobacteria bacterium]